MIFFRNKKTAKFHKKHNEIISLLEKGEQENLENLLWQPAGKKIEYHPSVFQMLQKLKRPSTSDTNLIIHKTIDKGNYQLLIFEVPWLDGDLKYTPLIFDKDVSKITGVMLPFNEVHGYLSSKQNADIGKLGIDWTRFVISVRF